MKYEPLKGKICRLVDAPWDVDEEERAFDFRDVKSAVQGLLQEVREHSFFSERDTDFYIKLDDIENLAKKWFADVAEGEE